jgi:hypothetical protein
MSDKINPNLTPRQRRTITALVTCGDITQAAADAKVSRDTIYRWMKQEGFKAALDLAVEDSLAALSRELVRLGGKATGVLSAAMEGNSPMEAAARVRAADIVLSRLLQLRELADFESRLNRLEKIRNETDK